MGMMIHEFTLNGINSRDLGVYIRSKQVFDKPQKNISYISVPGRDGDLIVDNGDFKSNLDITLGLRMFAPQLTDDKQSNFNMAYRKIVKWLSPSANYYIYSDTYDTEYYRLASVKSALKVTQQHYDVADFSVTLSCKPYKYRWDGDAVITLDGANANSMTIYNPEDSESLPIIKVYTSVVYDAQANVSHKFALNGTTYTITQINNNCTIDSEMMNVYHLTVNKNKNYQQTAFPKLLPGTNTLSLVNNGNVSKIEVTPRWRAI